MTLQVGDTIEGKYRIAGVLGEGGMGVVYAGEHVRIRRRVAIKVLHAATSRDAEAAARFEREAQAAGCIGNDHILEVLDVGELPGGDRYMVMEFLDGEPLAARIARLGRLPTHHAAKLLSQALEGLAAAHAAGIVHRDLKPDNIFILREKAGTADYVKLIDFGISKFRALGTQSNMTRTGTLMGTPNYMAPEQASGAQVDARSDVYAMGVILYETVTGRVPFQGDTLTELLLRITLGRGDRATVHVSDLDEALVSIIERAMAVDPAHRFASANEMRSALVDWMATGAGVSLPPPVDAASLVEARLSRALPTASVSGKTVSPWVSSAGLPKGVPAKRSWVPMVAVGGAVSLAVVLAGVAWLARSGAPADVSSAAAGMPAPSAAAPVASAAPRASETPPAPVAPLVPVASATAQPPSVVAPPAAPPKGAAAAPPRTAKPAPTAPAPTAPAPVKPSKPTTAPDFGY